ncbi:TlpA family protein disulfide reductase [Dyadobacter aurulentus]|uniref:TlpA family protein disulfide reductase n=1 Tax=Dyadobacter sp. UC 10 TaxID=2605428 RepID=UPI0011F15F6B|nr:TlpA disulfide reductase family protein [Dyadobacter sp. UC 10]KAA0991935.1 TlpA family protein disulfide reductase [Dyadobacter sp. UC 10]
MFHLFKITFLSLLLYVGLSGCEKKDLNQVTIIAELDSVANLELELVTFNMLNLDPVVLTKTRFDSTGKGEFKLSVDHPVFVYVNQKKSFVPLLISPGDNQMVTTMKSKTDQSVTYSGDGAIVNQYLQKINSTYGNYEVFDYRIFQKMTLDAFLAKRDSLEKQMARHFADLKKDKTVKPEILQIMETNNRIILYSYTQSYVTANFGYDMEDPGMSPMLKKSMADLPQDSLALAANCYKYGRLLATYLQSGIIWPADEGTDSSQTDGPEVSHPTFASREIESKNYIRPLEEHLKAANINYWFRSDGLSEEVNSLWTKYQKTARNPLYKEAIQKSYDEWAVLAPGKPAPDFTGTTADGKPISLSSLKGKLVYVDVWATWCGPCREEFPHSKKLVKEFEGSDKIVFLYVSTDSNMDTWKKFLPDKSVPAGIHMHQKQDGQSDAIWDNYHLWGIPRYILIDAKGKMLKTHAPRPSSEDILPLLKGYLKET